MISLRKYSLITDKHNQKLIKILENQKINGGFLKILIFGFHFPEPIYFAPIYSIDLLLCKWLLENETRNISILRKPP